MIFNTTEQVFVYLFAGCIIGLIVYAYRVIRKKMVLVKPPLSLLLIALIAGLVSTALYTAQMAWVIDNNCMYSSIERTNQDGSFDGLENSPLTGSCGNLAYGYPKKFISGEVRVAVAKRMPTNIDLKDIEVTSQMRLNGGALIINLFVSSAFSLTILYAIYVWLKSRDKPKSKK